MQPVSCSARGGARGLKGLQLFQDGTDASEAPGRSRPEDVVKLDYSPAEVLPGGRGRGGFAGPVHSDCRRKIFL